MGNEKVSTNEFKSRKQQSFQRLHLEEKMFGFWRTVLGENLPDQPLRINLSWRGLGANHQSPPEVRIEPPKVLEIELPRAREIVPEEEESPKVNILDDALKRSKPMPGFAPKKGPEGFKQVGLYDPSAKSK